MKDNVNKTKKKDCLEFALGKLSFRMRTEKELRDMLNEMDYSNDEIEATISFLKKSKYLDDKSYIIEYFRAKRHNFKAINYIVNSLYEKGIDRTLSQFTIEDYMAENSEFRLSDSDLAKVILERMIKDQKSIGKEIDDKFKAKVARRLNSLGYSSNTIYSILNELK